MGQSSTAVNISVGQAGQPADSSAAKSFVKTGRVETNISLVPGQFVVQGTADGEVALPAAAGETWVGLIRFSSDRKHDIDTGVPEPYGQYDLVSLAREKEWYVITEEAVAKDEQVFVRHTAGGGGSILGYARNDADTASAEAINAKFAETTAAAGIAKVELLLAQV